MVTEWSEKYQRISEECTGLKRALAMLEEAKARSDAEMSLLIERKDVALASARDLAKAEAERLGVENDRLKSQIESSNARALDVESDLSAQLQSSRASCADARRQCADAEEALQQLRAEKASVQEKYASLQKIRSREKESDAEHMNERCEQARRSGFSEGQAHAKARYREEADALRSQVSELRSSLETARRSLDSERRSLMDKARQERIASDERLSSIRLELDHAQQDWEASEKRRRNLLRGQERHASLENQIGVLKAELESARSELGVYQKLDVYSLSRARELDTLRSPASRGLPSPRGSPTLSRFDVARRSPIMATFDDDEDHQKV